MIHHNSRGVNAHATAARLRRQGPVLPGLRQFLTSPSTLRVAAVATVLLTAGPAFAADSGGDPMPWEGPMDRMLNFFTGPFVRIAAIIAIVLLGIGMAFSENGTGMRKMVTAFFGLALAFGAATWGLSFFGFSGGAAVPMPATTAPVEVVEESDAPSPDAVGEAVR
jgi:type IV secretion system protein VirB2